MNKEVEDILNQRRKLMILEYAKAIGSVTQTCQDLGIARSSFYEWKNAFKREGKAGLLRKKPILKSHPKKLRQSVIDKIIDLMYLNPVFPERLLNIKSTTCQKPLQREHFIQGDTARTYLDTMSR